MADLMERLLKLELEYEELIARVTALEERADALRTAQERWVKILDRLEGDE